MTDKARLLALLSDGRPHSHKEAYRLGLMAHSRAADLRKDGHDIRVWREDGLYLYQLTLREQQGPDGTEPSFASAALGAATESAPPATSSPSGSEGVGAAAAPSGQLVLDLPARLKEEAA